GSLLAAQRVLRELEQLTVGLQREVLLRDLRDERQLRGAARLALREVLLQGGVVEALDAPEEVQLEGRQRHLAGVVGRRYRKAELGGRELLLRVAAIGIQLRQAL